ncbi:hypothetical protein ACFSM7_09120 [Clavibacter michiganensis subsp. tessellarius]|uniref:hypothetical protein n=1 Tax=Clavibacter tessellarius TaxID=31965 RepID=UPI00363F46CE
MSRRGTGGRPAPPSSSELPRGARMPGPTTTLPRRAPFLKALTATAVRARDRRAGRRRRLGHGATRSISWAPPAPPARQHEEEHP